MAAMSCGSLLSGSTACPPRLSREGPCASSAAPRPLAPPAAAAATDAVPQPAFPALRRVLRGDVLSGEATARARLRAEGAARRHGPLPLVDAPVASLSLPVPHSLRGEEEEEEVPDAARWPQPRTSGAGAAARGDADRLPYSGDCSGLEMLARRTRTERGPAGPLAGADRLCMRDGRPSPRPDASSTLTRAATAASASMPHSAGRGGRAPALAGSRPWAPTCDAVPRAAQAASPTSDSVSSSSMSRSEQSVRSSSPSPPTLGCAVAASAELASSGSEVQDPEAPSLL